MNFKLLGGCRLTTSKVKGKGHDYWNAYYGVRLVPHGVNMTLHVCLSMNVTLKCFLCNHDLGWVIIPSQYLFTMYTYIDLMHKYARIWEKRTELRITRFTGYLKDSQWHTVLIWGIIWRAPPFWAHVNANAAFCLRGVLQQAYYVIA